MKYLITGGAGFIGSHYLNVMVKKYPNNEYVCLDLLTYAGNLNNIKDIIELPNFKFVQMDICDEENINKLFNKEKFDGVIHFAAETHVDNSFDNEKLFYKTNVIGTKVLLDASIKHNVKRFHHISTDEVYGSSNNEIFNEKSKLNPTNPYSKTKAEADKLVLEYYEKYDLYITISRSSNNFGPNQYPEKLIPLVINRIKNNEKIPLYGDGLNKRDWLYVIDNVNAIDLIVNKGKKGEIYNISSNNELTNLKVVKILLQKFNKDESLITFVKDRKIHDYKYTMDSSKIKNELGFEAKYTFIEGINELINKEIIL